VQPRKMPPNAANDALEACLSQKLRQNPPVKGDWQGSSVKV
jgi:hypothetical protein